jgi:3-hydroxyacyl-[acyl-carrier-protein] dehydratase
MIAGTALPGAPTAAPAPAPQTLEYADIRKILPHGFPFRLVDRVEDFEKGRWIRGAKNLAAREPFLDPAATGTCSPGLVIEAIGQLAIILFGLSRPEPSLPEILLGSISQVDVLAEVPTGGRLILEAEVVKLMDNSLIFNGRASLDGTPVLALQNLLAVTR